MVGGGGDALEQGIMDPQAMITHELGHWLGLAHTPASFGTMYFGLLPNGIQSTLAGDDKAGVCSLYPNDTSECEEDGDCPEDSHCVDIQGVSVCDELHDPTGAECDKTHIDCAGMCWVSLYECEHICYFTDQLQGTEGYCAPLCDPDTGLDCPEDYDCTAVAQLNGHICIKGFTPIWPTGDDPPEVVEMVAEVVEEPAEDLVAEEILDEDTGGPGPGADTAPAADTTTEEPGEGGGSSGCTSSPVAASPMVILLLALVMVIRVRPRGRPVHGPNRGVDAPPTVWL